LNALLAAQQGTLMLEAARWVARLQNWSFGFVAARHGSRLVREYLTAFAKPRSQVAFEFLLATNTCGR
jgi:hypothetical protein